MATLKLSQGYVQLWGCLLVCLFACFSSTGFERRVASRVSWPQYYPERFLHPMTRDVHWKCFRPASVSHFHFLRCIFWGVDVLNYQEFSIYPLSFMVMILGGLILSKEFLLIWNLKSYPPVTLERTFKFRSIIHLKREKSELGVSS